MLPAVWACRSARSFLLSENLNCTSTSYIFKHSAGISSDCFSHGNTSGNSHTSSGMLHWRHLQIDITALHQSPGKGNVIPQQDIRMQMPSSRETEDALVEISFSLGDSRKKRLSTVV